MLVTQNASAEDLILDPFPMFIIENAFPEPLHKELLLALPPLGELEKGISYPSNHRLNYSATNLAFNPRFPKVWKDFFQSHLNQPFLDNVLSLFSESILKEYPDFETRFRPLGELKAGIRPVDEKSDADVLLDCQLALNTPVSVNGTTVRAPHIDSPRKLFVGLFYLRLDEDDSQGGDLEIYRPRQKDLVLDQTRTASFADMELACRVPYKSNTLVLFLNTPVSFHGVSPRSRTPYHRLFVNILAEMRQDLFTLASRKSGPFVSGVPGLPGRSGMPGLPMMPGMAVSPGLLKPKRAAKGGSFLSNAKDDEY